MSEHVHEWVLTWRHSGAEWICKKHKKCQGVLSLEEITIRLNATERLSAENNTLKCEGDFLQLIGSNKDRLKCVICLNQIREADYEYDGTFPHKPDCLLADALEGSG